MHFERLVQSDTGKAIISILLGLGLAALFKKTCKGRKCVQYVHANERA